MTDKREDAQAHDSPRILELLSGAFATQVVYVAAELGLADFMSEGPRTSEELAARCGADEPSLRRLLHALGAVGLCRAGEDGAFALTPAGESLRSDRPDSLRSWARWWGRSLWPAFGELLHSVRTGESGRARIDGTRGFEHLSRDPEAAEVFYRATVELSRRSAPAVLCGCDFSRFARIVDVGGGYGELLIAILRAHPHASGTLFELPSAIPGARRHLAESGVGDRCTTVEGDFFTEVPVGADAYLLKSVLHDWNDEDAGRILSTCRRAMDGGARLVLVEQVRRPGDDSPAGLEAALSDLMMLVAHGAGERTLPEFGVLLRSAGFEVLGDRPVGCGLHVIEAKPGPGPAHP